MEELEHIFNEPAVRYQKANKGISKSEFLSVVAYSGLNLTTFSKLLPVSKRTIEKAKEDDLLTPIASDRVLQLASLYHYGAEVFGSKESFREWIDTALIALGGKKPFDFMDNDTGISLVNDLIGRIEHGVYS